MHHHAQPGIKGVCHHRWAQFAFFNPSYCGDDATPALACNTEEGIAFFLTQCKSLSVVVTRVSLIPLHLLTLIVNIIFCSVFYFNASTFLFFHVRFLLTVSGKCVHRFVISCSDLEASTLPLP